MMMKLYTSAASPFARKVRVCLSELGLADRVEQVEVGSTPLKQSPVLTAQNPLGKIPCLLRADGTALYDSRVITRYLDDLAGGSLYPAAPELWDVLTLEATADGIMDAAVMMVYEKRVRPEELVFATWVESQWVRVTRALDAIEQNNIGQLSGPLNIAQIAVGSALEYLDFRHADRDWRAERPALADWQAAFALREAMQATRPGA